MLNYYRNIENIFNLKVNLIILVVVFVKIFIATYFYSPLPENSYIPYLQEIVKSFSVFVDKTFLNENPELHFPYGIMMVIVFYPLFALSNFVNIPQEFAYFGTLLISDLLILFLLSKIVNLSKLKLILFYWMNPIIFIVTYLLGFNDIVPTLFLVLTIYFLKFQKYTLTAIMISIAISCKFSMFLIIPILLIYLHHNKLVRHNLNSFLFKITFFLTILIIPQFLNQLSMQMFLNNPNALETIFVKSLKFGNHELLIMPILYCIILMLIWNISRLNLNLFLNITLIVFLSIIFLINSSPGWYVWVIPVFFLFKGNFSIKDIYLISLFVILILFEIIFIGPLGFYSNLFYSDDFIKFIYLNKYIEIIHSIYFAVGIIVILRLWKLGINDNYYYKIWRKPFLVGISGNSGVGKTTLTKNLELVFGNNSVTNVKGDGYHIWDRNRSIWDTLTHLNPRANELEQLYEDIGNLIFGKRINLSNYNHQTGKKNQLKNILVKNFVLLEGLHILIFKKLREKCDIKIFMEVSENLRRNLKIERDVNKRGYNKEDVLKKLNKRKIDELKYIEIQRNFSDLIINIKDTKNYSKINNSERLSVEIISKDPTYFMKLTKVLTKITNIGFETSFGDENKISFYGTISEFDVFKVAKEMMPNYYDIFVNDAKWSNGAKGIVQLICVIEIYQQIMKRMN